MSRKILGQEGFTLVEITIAMAIFGTLMVVTIAGLLSIIRLYRNGIGQRDTQANARYILENIVRDARNAPGIKIKDTNGDHVADLATGEEICFKPAIGGVAHRYYLTGGEVHRVENVCTSSVDTGSGVNDVVLSSSGSSTQVEQLTINPFPTASPIGIDISVIVRTNDTLPGTTTCPTGPGSEFCSITRLDTSAIFRGK